MKKILCILAMVACSNAAIFNYYHVKADGTGSIADSAATWANAWNEDTLEKYLEASVVAGAVFYVRQGTYTFTADINSALRDGSAISPIVFIGVKTATTDTASNITRAMWCSDTATYPKFSLDTREITVGDYYTFRGISMYGPSNPTCLSMGANCIVKKCIFNQTSATASRYCLAIDNSSIVDSCVFTSAACRGINSGAYARTVNSVFYNFNDATNGLAITAGLSSNFIVGNVFKSVKVAAIDLAGDDNASIINNTFYNCGTDISATDAFGIYSSNNIHDSTKTDAYKWTTQTDINYFAGNHAGRCADYVDGVDSSGIFGDASLTTGDPLFQNPPDSLQLENNSPARNVGTGLK